MARITVEDCLVKENNRFALVQLAAKRAKQLLHGAKANLSEDKGNKAVVTALREIADGKVGFMTAEEIAAAEELARVEREREEAERAAIAQQAQEAGEAERNRIFRPRIAEPAGGEDDIDDEGDDEDEELDEDEEKDEKEKGKDAHRNGDGSSGL